MRLVVWALCSTLYTVYIFVVSILFNLKEKYEEKSNTYNMVKGEEKKNTTRQDDKSERGQIREWLQRDALHWVKMGEKVSSVFK